MNYTIYSLIALVFWGIWAYLCKVLTKHLSTELLAFYTTLGSLIAITIYTLFRTKVILNAYTGWAMLTGISAMVATFAFYVALAKGPASVVVPWTGLYIIIPVILGFIFLSEPITINHIFGIIFAIASIFFLSR